MILVTAISINKKKAKTLCAFKALKFFGIDEEYERFKQNLPADEFFLEQDRYFEKLLEEDNEGYLS